MRAIKQDIKRFLAVFFACIVINYFFPRIIAFAWFFGLLVFFVRAKNQHNYFWIMLFMLLLSAPGNLFHNLGQRPLPMIPVPGFDRAIFFGEIFGMLAIAKAYMAPEKQKAFYEKPLTIVIIFAVFLLFLGLIEGLDVFKFLRTIRFIIPIILLLSIPRLVPYHTAPRAISLLFSSAAVLLLCQNIRPRNGNAGGVSDWRFTKG